MKALLRTLLKAACLIVSVLLLTACPKEKDPVPAPVADFGYYPEVNLVAPIRISFVNYSTDATSYLWETEDGQRSTAENPTFTFNRGGIYTITLTAIGEGGKDTYEDFIYVEDAVVTPPVSSNPVASFTYTPAQNLTAPVKITFTNTSKNAETYRWDFGDGTTSTETSPTKEFTKAGTFKVKLTASNKTTSAAGTADITVDAAVVATSPSADFTYSPGSNLTAPVTVTFTNGSRNATSYLWEFGDGTTSTSISPSKQFTKAGDYAVKLTATDAKNQKAQKNATITVKAAAPTPVADWTWTASNLKVTFTNASKNATSYSWNFNDGTSSTATNPVHEYAKAGVYTVTLTASDGKTQVQDSKLVTISAPVAAACNWPVWNKYATVSYVYQYKTNGCSLNKFKDVTLITFKNVSNVTIDFKMYIQRQDGSWTGRQWLWTLKPGQEIKNWDDCGLAKQVTYWVRPATTGSNPCSFPDEP